MNYGAAKAERLPTLNASANYGSIGTEISGAQPTYDYGFSLRVPLFDGGRRDARRGESLSQYRQEQTRTRDVEQQVELDVRLAFDSIASAAVEVTTAREGVDLSEKELAQAKRRYQAGVANSLEITDAQTRLDRARDNLIIALLQLQRLAYRSRHGAPEKSRRLRESMKKLIRHHFASGCDRGRRRVLVVENAPGE